MLWQKSPQYEGMPYEEYIKTEEGQRFLRASGFYGPRSTGKYDPGRAQPMSAPEPQPGGFPPVPQTQTVLPFHPRPVHGAGYGQVSHTVIPTSPGMPYGTIGQDGRIDYGYGPGVFAPPQGAVQMPAYGPWMY